MAAPEGPQTVRPCVGRGAPGGFPPGELPTRFRGSAASRVSGAGAKPMQAQRGASTPAERVLGRVEHGDDFVCQIGLDRDGRFPSRRELRRPRRRGGRRSSPRSWRTRASGWRGGWRRAGRCRQIRRSPGRCVSRQARCSWPPLRSLVAVSLRHEHPQSHRGMPESTPRSSALHALGAARNANARAKHRRGHAPQCRRSTAAPPRE